MILKNISIKASLVTIIVLATIFLTFNTIQDYMQWRKTKEIKHVLNTYVKLSKSLSALIHETQKERGASAGFLGSKGKKFKIILSKQKLLTNKKIKNFENLLKNINQHMLSNNVKNDINKLQTYLDQLNKVRNEVSNFEISVKQKVSWYSKMNAVILKIIGDTSKAAQMLK